MSAYHSIFELIDMRSFSNLWYWIALAVTWSTASHWVVGVPFDMVARARRHGGKAQTDLEDMARINVNRILHLVRVSGSWLTAIVCCLLTMLAVLGFWYWVEFAQAVLLIAFPLTLVGLMSVRTAHLIEAGEGRGEALYRRMIRHRFYTQVIGVLTIFVAAMWGMYQNLMIGVLGH